MKALDHLFQNNRLWASSHVEDDPHFFERLTQQQSPEYLWIGCSDSRVPANEIVGMLPGELFVHRNVANLVIHTDMNCLSVLQYAVEVLKVKHIIICGHYGCGGVNAALCNDKLGLIDNWLRNVQDVNLKHHTFLESIEDDAERLDRICELNVVEQVVNLVKTTIVQGAWSRNQELSVHGLIYKIQDGLLRDLGMHVSLQDELETCYEKALENFNF
ncbi:MAG: carbonate dehydratase [Gammaproteobacteria bacterium]